MRLGVLDDGHQAEDRAILDRLEELRGAKPTDVLKTFCYRKDFFGETFSQLVDSVLRAPSPHWSDGERELFATLVSARNQCPF